MCVHVRACACMHAYSLLHSISRDKTGLAVGIPEAHISNSFMIYKVAASLNIKITVFLHIMLCNLVVGTSDLENPATSSSQSK